MEAFIVSLVQSLPVTASISIVIFYALIRYVLNPYIERKMAAVKAQSEAELAQVKGDIDSNRALLEIIGQLVQNVKAANDSASTERHEFRSAIDDNLKIVNATIKSLRSDINALQNQVESLEKTLGSRASWQDIEALKSQLSNMTLELMQAIGSLVKYEAKTKTGDMSVVKE